MNGNELLRIVDAIHRDKNIDKEIVFEGIEQAIISAARKHFGEESEVVVGIDRDSGEPSAAVDGDALEADEIGDLLGRIAAQTAKQVMIQKIREAERDALFDEYTAIRSHIVTGVVSRAEGSAATVNLGKVEALLPRSEQIPGESHRAGERVRAIVLEVRKAGSRVKIILSRAHPELVRRLFEIEIPEVAEQIIDVRSLAREAGYRSKVAVACYDNKVDAVGACVGVRGARIKSIVEELAGERIDIVRWNDSLQVLVPNALQPAEVEDVILCPMLGKVIVLVREDQLSLAIGKKGQNVRLASKLVGWDIHVMTEDRLQEQLDTSVAAFSVVPGITEDLAQNLVEQGFFSFDDLSVIEPDQLAELGGLSAEQCDEIVAYADEESIRLEKEERAAARRRSLEAAVAAEKPDEPPAESEAPESESEAPELTEAAEPATGVVGDESALAAEAPETEAVLSGTEAEPVGVEENSGSTPEDLTPEEAERAELAAEDAAGVAMQESPTPAEEASASSSTVGESAAAEERAEEEDRTEAEQVAGSPAAEDDGEAVRRAKASTTEE